jgi:membrane protein DedA with SNARE-associated domain
VRELLVWMAAVPHEVVYVALACGAAVENVFPAIPADTFVALGGLLSAIGQLEAGWVFAVTWVANVGAALATYRVGYVRGPAFFTRGWGRHLIRPHQMERMKAFYARWGVPAIFLTRFLPGVRVAVPIFAGVTRHGWLTVALPLALASAIWYGGLVWLGALAGRNLDVLTAMLGRVNGVLAVAAGLVGGLAFLWWWRTRHPRDE